MLPFQLNLSCRPVLAVLGLLAAVLAPIFAGAAEPKQPNIVILLADDLGWNDVSWNNPAIKTPNLDRLCRAGVRLARQYVHSMCTPTRAALVSGRFATRFGIDVAQNERALPYDTTTLMRVLDERGYDTALIGKWHLGSASQWGPQKYNFDYSYGALSGGCGPYSHLYKAGPYTRTWHRNGTLIEETGHVTDLIAREAVQWLGQRGDQPFFLYVPFTAPHVPVQEPARWLGEYPELTNPAKREFYAAVTHMDWAVGEIMQALERTGRRADTIVIFLSDNGATPDQPNESWLNVNDPRDHFTPGPAGGSNAPLRGRKTTVYEGGLRVPAFVNWPGLLKPGTFGGVVHVVDWMPTLCGLVGFQPATDPKWDGRDLWPALTGRMPATSRQLYWVSARATVAAVRDGDWKLVVTKEGDRAELFNLAADPNEKRDLAAAEPKRVAALRRLWAELAARDGDAKVTETGPKVSD